MSSRSALAARLFPGSIRRRERFSSDDERRRPHAESLGEREQQLVCRIHATSFQRTDLSELDVARRREILRGGVPLVTDLADRVAEDEQILLFSLAHRKEKLPNCGCRQSSETFSIYVSYVLLVGLRQAGGHGNPGKAGTTHPGVRSDRVDDEGRDRG